MAMLAEGSLKYDDTSDYNLISFVIKMMKRHLPFSTLQIFESIRHIFHLKVVFIIVTSHVVIQCEKNFVIEEEKIVYMGM